MAGVLAAVGAARQGASVLLVERHGVLGGQGTAGGVCGLCGDTQRVNEPFAEIVAELERHDAIAPYCPDHDQRAYDIEWMAFVLQERALSYGVELLLWTQALEVEREGERVESVLIANKSGLQAARPGVVVDTTGEADLVHRGGWPTLKGGPPQGLQLPTSLYFTLWDTGAPVKPRLPPGCPTWESDDELPMTTLHVRDTGRLDVKMKVIGCDATEGRSVTEGEIAARRQMMGLVYHLQTKGYAGRVFDTYCLAATARQLGVREGRRIDGEYVLTEEDVRAGRSFPDAIAVGTYHLDYHWPDRLQRAGTGITTMVPPYHIPARCLWPEGGANLLTAGRSVSGDQMAMSSYRVMATCAQTGLAAGVIAARAAQEGVAPGALDTARVQAALASEGQDLDLSHYGEYLREPSG